jgi:AraC family transcriptional regulator, transcriptional activator of pobA
MDKMKNIISPFEWRTELVNKDIDSIGDDFFLFDNLILSSAIYHPIKLDVSVAIICCSGTMKGSINLKQYSTNAPCLVIIVADQILQYEKISEDFSGLFIVMSKRFTDDLFMSIQERYPLKHSIYDNPWTPLNEEELASMTDYFKMLQASVRIKENPHRIEIVKNLTRAFFYRSGYQYHKIPEKENESKNEILLEKFLNQVQSNYKEHRGLEFYADKLCFTPKYLSKVIKEASGESASEWIDNYVILDAKALLKSSNMTIQQISNELNFPSQSFFGKYFKRYTGMSPKEYRKN